MIEPHQVLRDDLPGNFVNLRVNSKQSFQQISEGCIKPIFDGIGGSE